MQDLRARAIERLRALRRTPRMWARTREAFVAQVAVLLDLLGSEGRIVHDVFKVPGTSAADVASLVAEVDDVWARRLLDEAVVRAGIALDVES